MRNFRGKIGDGIIDFIQGICKLKIDNSINLPDNVMNATILKLTIYSQIEENLKNKQMINIINKVMANTITKLTKDVRGIVINNELQELKTDLRTELETTYNQIWGQLSFKVNNEIGSKIRKK